MHEREVPIPEVRATVKTPIIDPIATRSFVLMRSGRTNVAVTLVVGKPYIVDEREARCPIRIDGLAGQYDDVSGGDTFQALSLALRFLRLRIDEQVADGDRFADFDDGVAYDSQELGAVFGVPPDYTRPPDLEKR